MQLIIAAFFLLSLSWEYNYLSITESVKPVDNTGALIWAALGPKTIELVHENIVVEGVPNDEDLEILELDADLIEQFMEHRDPETIARKIEIDLIARIRKNDRKSKFVSLGKRLEELRERHAAGLVTSVEFLKAIIELAKEARAAEKEVVPEEQEDKGRAALTELFQGIRNESTPVIVENIVSDIDNIVRTVRFDGWQNTTAGAKEVKKELRKILWMRYKLKDQELFDKAYGYIEMYY